MENIIKDDWPIVITVKNMPVSLIRVYDSDGIEYKYLYELNRITGEGKQYSTDDSGNMFTILGVPATEEVKLKTPITITRNHKVLE